MRFLLVPILVIISVGRSSSACPKGCCCPYDGVTAALKDEPSHIQMTYIPRKDSNCFDVPGHSYGFICQKTSSTTCTTSGASINGASHDVNITRKDNTVQIDFFTGCSITLYCDDKDCMDSNQWQGVYAGTEPRTSPLWPSQRQPECKSSDCPTCCPQSLIDVVQVNETLVEMRYVAKCGGAEQRRYIVATCDVVSGGNLQCTVNGSSFNLTRYVDQKVLMTFPRSGQCDAAMKCVADSCTSAWAGKYTLIEGDTRFVFSKCPESECCCPSSGDVTYKLGPPTVINGKSAIMINFTHSSTANCLLYRKMFAYSGSSISMFCFLLKPGVMDCQATDFTNGLLFDYRMIKSGRLIDVSEGDSCRYTIYCKGGSCLQSSVWEGEYWTKPTYIVVSPTKVVSPTASVFPSWPYSSGPSCDASKCCCIEQVEIADKIQNERRGIRFQVTKWGASQSRCNDIDSGECWIDSNRCVASLASGTVTFARYANDKLTISTGSSDSCTAAFECRDELSCPFWKKEWVGDFRAVGTGVTEEPTGGAAGLGLSVLTMIAFIIAHTLA
ncbi:uncharacterized protein [Oscarella lobularis]|uniref:uncharacterized protein n=1 Tax=Oscarella lobularis TaxID=121494 RepID=UPI0033134611